MRGGVGGAPTPVVCQTSIRKDLEQIQELAAVGVGGELLDVGAFEELGEDIAAGGLRRLHYQVCGCSTCGIFGEEDEGLQRGEVLVVGHGGRFEFGWVGRWCSLESWSLKVGGVGVGMVGGLGRYHCRSLEKLDLIRLLMLRNSSANI